MIGLPMEYNMGNILKKIKCPFLATNKFCTHNGNPPNSHRVVCGYKNCVDCELFLQWYEMYKLNKESSPESLLHTLEWILQPTTALLFPKLNCYMLNTHLDNKIFLHVTAAQMKANVCLCLCLMGLFGDVNRNIYKQ